MGWEGMTAIGLLALLAAAGWGLYARTRKRTGELEHANEILRAERGARIRQDKSFDEHRGRDRDSDAEFLRIE